MNTNEANAQIKKRDILKSTSLLGGSTGITILIGMIKTKFIAVLLGPGGVGFIGVLNSLREIVSSVTGMGLSSSGVREIASGVSKNDRKAIFVTVKTLRMLVMVTGIIGMLVMIAGSVTLSKISFKTSKYALAIAFMGLAVLINAISIGQTTIIQGTRRIKDVAKINIIGSIMGTSISIPIFYLWGINGVVPSLVLSVLATLITSYYFASKIDLEELIVIRGEVINEAKKLLFLGFPIMLSGLVGSLSLYFIRVFLTREAGLDSLGYYQAAFSLSGVLVSFILNAMGTDYYPRLTAVAEDDKKIYNEVNAQTEIALLLAVPLLSATIVFMPIVIRLFYSSSFSQAVSILQWAVFGIIGRVISWPMSFIMLAKARGRLFFLSELSCGIIHVISVVVFYKIMGLPGSGFAFALLYFFYIILMLVISNKLTGFTWTRNNKVLIAISVGVIILLSIIQKVCVVSTLKYIIGGVILLFSSLLYLRKLIMSIGLKKEHLSNIAKALKLKV